MWVEENMEVGNVIIYKLKDRRFDCASIDGFIEAPNHTYNLQNQ